MGVITDEEAKCGEYMPVWVASKENTVTSWFNSPNPDDMDIRSSFHIYAILQRGEANKYPELSDFFMKQSSVYEKLDNVMDYIFLKAEEFFLDPDCNLMYDKLYDDREQIA